MPVVHLKKLGENPFQVFDPPLPKNFEEYKTRNSIHPDRTAITIVRVMLPLTHAVSCFGYADKKKIARDLAIILMAEECEGYDDALLSVCPEARIQRTLNGREIMACFALYEHCSKFSSSVSDQKRHPDRFDVHLCQRIYETISYFSQSRRRCVTLENSLVEQHVYFNFLSGNNHDGIPNAETSSMTACEQLYLRKTIFLF